MKKISHLVFVLFAVTGCANSNIAIPVDALVEGSTDISHVIGDASTAKEAIVHKTIQGYYTEYAAAFAKSGTTIEFELVEVKPGIFVQMMKKVSSRGDVKMFAPPTKPSEHPVWAMVDNVLNKGLAYGFGYLAVDSVVSGFTELGKSAGNYFYGDAQVNGAFNVAGNDQSIVTGAMGQHNTQPAELEELVPFNLEECLANPPGGIVGGVPMYDDKLSCGSFGG